MPRRARAARAHGRPPPLPQWPVVRRDGPHARREAGHFASARRARPARLAPVPPRPRSQTMNALPCAALGVEELLAPDARAIAHLGECGACRRLGADYRWIVGAIAALPVRRARPESLARIASLLSHFQDTVMPTVDIKHSTNL